MALIKRSIFIIVIALLGFSLSYLSVTEAYRLRPGDHVFDAKRFSDSLKETAQMLENVQNSLENLKNRIVFNSKIDAFDNIQEELNKIKTTFENKSLLNPNNVLSDSPFWKSWNATDALKDTTYKQTLNNELSISNKETEDITQEVLQNQQSYDALKQDLLNEKTNGVVAEKQRANALSIIDAITSANKTNLTGTKLINNITEQEAAAAAERLDEEKVKAGQFYGYDPYHPNKFDQEHHPQDEPMGLVPFGQ